MISHKHKFIFIHIPKTGGTSFAYVLGNYCEYIVKHQFAQDIMEEQKEGIEYYRFTLVRNPWEREVSRYFYQRMKAGHELHEEAMKLNFKQWLKRRHNDSFFMNFLGAPQVEWIIDNDGNNMLDFIARLETIDKDWGAICKKLNINARLPHLNKTGHTHYSDYYDSETKGIIEKAYEKDIEFFGYKFKE